MPLQALDPNAQFQIPGMMDQSQGAEAQSKLYDIGANSLGNMAQILQEHAAKTAELTGALAGAKAALQYDENGNLLPLTGLPMDQSIASQSFRESAINIYTNTVSNQATQYARALARNPGMQANPDLFRQTWNQYQSKTLTDVDPLVAGTLTPKLIDIGGSTYSDLADKLAVSQKNSAGLLGEQSITELQGRIAQRVDTMGDTAAARDIIKQKAGTELQDLLVGLTSADPNKYNMGALRAKAIDYFQKSYLAMISGQAAQYGGAGIRQPDGKTTGDLTGYTAYLDKLRADPEIAQIFPGDQFNSMVVPAAKARYDLAELGTTAQRTQTDINADMANTGNVAQLNVKAEQGTALWNTQRDPTQLEDVIKEANQTTFSRNGAEDANLRSAFQLGLVKKIYEAYNSPSAVEEMRLLHTILDPTRKGPNLQIPPTREGNNVLKTAQLTWDQKAAASIGPGALMSGKMDPQALYPLLAAPHVGFFDATGRIPPRMVEEWKTGLGHVSWQDAHNIYGNFLTSMQVAPDQVKEEIGDTGIKAMELWGAVGEDQSEYVKMSSILKGGEMHTAYDHAAQQIITTYSAATGGKDRLYGDMKQGIQRALIESSTPLAAGRAFLGFPNDASAGHIPDNYKEGYFGLFLPQGDMKRALGYTSVGDIRINTDQETEDKFLYAAANAAGNGNRDARATSAAIGDLYNQDKTTISKLLMPKRIDLGTPGQWRDLTDDFTLGKYAPEAYYKTDAVNLAMDISLKASEDWSKQPAVREQFVSIDPTYSQEFNLGDRRHWAEEYTKGRLKMDPQTGIGGKFLGYNILALVETGTDHQWIQLNPPGQLYNFDAQNGPLAREALKGAAANRSTALAVEGASGGGAAGRVAGTAAGGITGWFAGEWQREFEGKGKTHTYFPSLWDKLFGGGTAPLTSPPSAVLKQ